MELSPGSPSSPRREGALILFNLEHLAPAERSHAWLGGLRPSEACAGVLAKLGDAATEVTQIQMRALQVGEGLGLNESS